MTEQPLFQIFDSMDRSASPIATHPNYLYAQCARLNREADENGDLLTYAIGKITPDGGVTFD